jgi:hypothetical protein
MAVSNLCYMLSPKGSQRDEELRCVSAIVEALDVIQEARW